jgi:hypothetical protein
MAVTVTCSRNRTRLSGPWRLDLTGLSPPMPVTQLADGADGDDVWVSVVQGCRAPLRAAYAQTNCVRKCTETTVLRVQPHTSPTRPATINTSDRTASLAWPK